MGGECKNVEFLYAFEHTDCYNHKMFYVSLMVTTKQKPKLDLQKIGKQTIPPIYKENHQFT